MWTVPESEVRILPDVRGLDVVDLGCGTGYWCAWFHRLGARPVGLDVAEGQLDTARALQREHGIDLPLVHASAEAPPFPDASFDLVFSEYGAAIWCDPYAWIPQAHRLLRPGGRLIFLANSVLAMLTAPPNEDPCGEVLLRPQFGLHRLDWPDTGGTDFHLPHSAMLGLLRDTGFAVEALHEPRAPEGDEDEVRFFIRRGWARAALAVRGGLGRAQGVSGPSAVGLDPGPERGVVAEAVGPPLVDVFGLDGREAGRDDDVVEAVAEAGAHRPGAVAAGVAVEGPERVAPAVRADEVVDEQQLGAVVARAELLAQPPLAVAGERDDLALAALVARGVEVAGEHARHAVGGRREVAVERLERPDLDELLFRAERGVERVHLDLPPVGRAAH